MEIKIENIADLPVGYAMAVLIYGGSGSGKTWFCGTAGSRAILIDCGASPVDTLVSKKFKDTVGTNLPKRVKLRDTFKEAKVEDPLNPTKYKNILVPLGEAVEQLKEITRQLCKMDDVDIIIWDNATAISEWSMVWSERLGGALKSSYTYSNFTEKHGFIHPEIQDYNILQEVMTSLFRNSIEFCKDHGKDLMVTAHERLTFTKPMNKEGKVVIGEPPILLKVEPGFKGKAMSTIAPQEFDEVWRFDVVGKGTSALHRMQTSRDDTIFAKTTHGAGVLRLYETDPNYLKIKERIVAGKPPTKLGAKK